MHPHSSLECRKHGIFISLGVWRRQSRCPCAAPWFYPPTRTTRTTTRQTLQQKPLLLLQLVDLITPHFSYYLHYPFPLLTVVTVTVTISVYYDSAFLVLLHLTIVVTVTVTISPYYHSALFVLLLLPIPPAHCSHCYCCNRSVL